MRNKFLIILLALSLLASGCVKKDPNQEVQGNENQENQNQQQEVNENGRTEQNSAQNDSEIMKFGSEDELREFLEDNSGSSDRLYTKEASMSRSMPSFGMGSTDDMLWGGFQSEIKSAEGLGDGSADYSETNIQVEGVDEADIIKTDGQYIYAVAKNDLFIIKAYPADKAEILAKIEFKSRPKDIYLADKRLVIFGQDTEFLKSEENARIWPGRKQFTFFKIFDINDPKNPKQIKDFNFEGSYHNSRMIGDYVYFVTQNYAYNIMDDQPVLPIILEGGKKIDYACTDGDHCVWPDVYYFDMPYNSHRFTAVNSINIKDPQEIESNIYLMDNNQNMYVSLNNIYITYTKYVSEFELQMEVMKEVVFPRLSEQEREKIAKIEAAENFLLSQDEKLMKIAAVLERFARSLSKDEEAALEKEVEESMKNKYRDIAKEMEKTVIHKIAIDKGSLEYKTGGEVTGQVLNQFSMDENNGYFRIATTKNRTWSQYIDDKEENLSYSNLYVLDQDLKQVGALENLAPDERIYSVRFMQNRAYMVTFKQIDPLFVIDLADPTNPKVLGELKIPGFSNYLHPYDENHLIGIGKDAKENQRGGATTLGVKLSLFDVSDVANPREVDSYIAGEAGSDSIALHDHKAFLFDKEKNLLVIPASLNEYRDSQTRSRLSFSGALVFRVDKTGFELKGRIDHSDGGKASVRDSWGGITYYDNSVKRALYIGNTLYTFSNQYLKMNQLEGLNEINLLRLKKEAGGNDDYRVIN